MHTFGKSLALCIRERPQEIRQAVQAKRRPRGTSGRADIAARVKSGRTPDDQVLSSQSPGIPTAETAERQHLGLDAGVAQHAANVPRQSEN